MSAELITNVMVFMLAAFLGLELIRRVPTLLHTPLMSGTNAISGIVIVGAILVGGASGATTAEGMISFVAIVLAMINVVGGFLVTDRMLGMFRRRDRAPRE